ncbi:plasmid stabilization system [Sphingomonas sp. LH128]|uniref:HEPN domain-containing protein n=1 Tax=Sphingomonas sp. LH128 TaxID=473781 RepID=UPI00027CC1E6|nr:HEPN domain-containing protein [Sphingomonas sp. LH128]EJU14974.1 plasmid stabilization system [Sphingomonas sp. LH128]
MVEEIVKPVSNVRFRIEKLPRRAQHDIERATQILREEFVQATTGCKIERHNAGRLLKIILFGSYAKGKQVVDPVGRYFSDYDLLVVVDKEELTDASKYWSKAEDRVVDMLTERGWPQPLSLIIHTLDDVNHQLRRGRNFWVDLVREGIVLFEEPDLPFEKAGLLSKQEAQEEAEIYFRREFKKVGRSMRTAELQRKEEKEQDDHVAKSEWRNEAAFNLHQAMERAYYCIMLVLTSYSPKSHNLNFLSKRAEQQDERLIGVWKTDTKFGRRCYELLRAAYVKSRYSDHYRISNEELDWITDRVVELQELTRIICEERIARLGGPDTAAL